MKDERGLVTEYAEPARPKPDHHQILVLSCGKVRETKHAASDPLEVTLANVVLEKG